MILWISSIFVLVFVLSYSLVWLIFRYSQKHSVLDLPNDRSSHTRPTPTGGGLAISLCSIGGLLATAYFGLIEQVLLIALLPAFIIITITGWIDDHQHIRTSIRAIIYFSAAIWLVFYLGGFSSLNISGQAIQLNWLGLVLAVLGIVWIINLYNFMDGIDGLAAVEAITTGLGSGLLLFYSGLQGEALLCLIVIVAAAAYLVWNWPPAKIFMGDVGSCPLGLFFAALALWSHNNQGPSVYIWLILLAVFIADATYTLILRLVRKQKWYSAHRSHAYQKLVQMGYTHKQVTISILLLNMFFLWPMAWYSYRLPDQAVVLTLISYLLLLFAWGWIQIKTKHL